jgi:hypothetical protein
MAHNRKLVIGAVSLTAIKLPAAKIIFAMSNIRDKVELIIADSGYLEGAPFQWIGIMIREGLVDNFHPKYKKIDVSDGELLISIEIDARKMVGIEINDIESQIFDAIVTSLIHIGNKYNLNIDGMKNLR